MNLAGLRRLFSENPHFLLWIVQLSFASGAVFGKLAMAPASLGGGAVSPYALAMVRMAAGALFFGWLSKRRGRTRAFSRAEHGKLLVLAVLGVVLNQVLYIVGLARTHAASAALLSVTIPLFASSLSVLLGKEALSSRLLLGLALAAAGVFSLVGLHAPDRGVLFVVANSFSYALYVVLARDLLVQEGPLRILAGIFFWGAVVYAPVGIPALLLDVAAWSRRSAVLVAYVTLVPTILAYLAHARALSLARASLVTLYIALQPLLAALFSSWVFETSVPSSFPLATFLILGALLVRLTERGEKKGPSREESE